MTKAQIYFSNNLEMHLQILKQLLFIKNTNPFEKRLIVVPNLELKTYLMHQFATDPDLQVAAGMHILSLNQAWSTITRKKLPTKIELSLFLQHTLIPMISKEPELKKYFTGDARGKRIGPFCDILAQYFQKYSIYGKEPLNQWQEILWEKVKENWTFPTDEPASLSKWDVHLFGFSFLPKTYFTFFQKQKAVMYLISFCEIFWGDFYSEKEKKLFTKNLSSSQRDLFEKTFEEQNVLLANWGKVNRKMHQMVEESNLPTQEQYIHPKKHTCLHDLQRSLLSGEQKTFRADSSIQCVSATTPLREIEILKDFILERFEEGNIKPQDIQVFAPDMNVYAPYIHALFQDIPYTISSLRTDRIDEMSYALSQLLEIPKNRFSLESVLQIFSVSLFREKFSFDVTQIRKWLELANVRWGFSKEQRAQFYLQEMKKEQIIENTEDGTWKKGLHRLLLGLGQIEGKDFPLCAVEMTEIEQFDKLYSLMYSLTDDLSVLQDGTKWTIPIWLRYFACLLETYFSIDPSNFLYKQLLELAAKCDFLDGEEIPYEGIERILFQILTKKEKTFQASLIQAIRFGSFFEECVFPGKIIYLLGMQEDAFPKKEGFTSLYFPTKDYCPLQNEKDRNFFLQILLSATEQIGMSYIRDEVNKGMSPLIEELFSFIEKGKIIHHPNYPFDPKYFQNQYKTYSHEQYEIAYARKKGEILSPLIPEFYEPISLDPPEEIEKEIDVQKLFKFAKHPLRYYFHEILGIKLPYKKNSEEREVFLDPLTKHKLVQKAFTKPLDQVLEEAEKEGELPFNLFYPFAKEQITKEIEEWQNAMALFDLDPKKIESKKVDFRIGKLHLMGEMKLFSSRGMLVRGKDTLENRIQFWPHILLMQELGYSLFFTQHQNPISSEGSLEEYLNYFCLASQYPSPLLPSFAKPLLEGTGEDLQKEIIRVKDEIWTWLFFRDPIPNGKIIHENWSKFLQAVFRKHAKV